VPRGIVASGLRKTYRTSNGPIEAVRGIDVAIEPGETVALLGPNGAGKSTTIDLLLGLTRPDAGSVTVFGSPPAAAVDRGAVGAMLQSGSLIRDLTVRELLAQMASLYPDALDVDETLELVGIAGIAGQRTQKLSGGQSQRVRFALALVANAELLVLDEPTVGMDVQSRHAFWETMRGAAADGRTVLFATHYLEEADAYADRAVLMASGRIVADGPTTEIKAMVGTRTIRATLPDVPVDELAQLPGVSRAERRGESVALACTDSDAAIRALLDRHRQVRDIEIRGAGLEEAFLARVPRRPLLPDRRPNRTETDLGGSGISAPVYVMVGLAAFGTMNSMLGAGARVAAERSAGWNRQLRLTPLSTRAYFRAKVITGYAMSAATVALGILIGHLLTADSVGPAIGGVTALLSILGGVWFPVGSGGILHNVAQALPSYWLVQASHVGIGGPGWSSTGWIVVTVWTAVAARLAMREYRRDTGRQ
jgi:ABC-2 type transport system ATP-binding protein